MYSRFCAYGIFGIGIVVPVVKDRLGNLCVSDNYRPVTVSPFVSKIFEYCVLHKFKKVFESDSLQFGFKKNLSCSHALFVLSQHKIPIILLIMEVLST